MTPVARAKHSVNTLRNESNGDASFNMAEVDERQVTRLVEALNAPDAHLNQLSFRNSTIAPNGLKRILQAVKQHQLTSLEFSAHDFSQHTDEEFELLLETLREQTQLKSLRLSAKQGTLTEAQNIRLIEALRDLPHLETITINRYDHSAILPILAKVLPTLPIKTLTVENGGQVESEDMHALLEGVAQCSQLQTLDVSNTSLDAEHGQRIAELMQKRPDSNLTVYKLYKCQFDNETATHLICSALRSPNLVHVTLTGDLTEEQHATIDQVAQTAGQNNLSTLVFDQSYSRNPQLKTLTGTNRERAKTISEALAFELRNGGDVKVKGYVELYARRQIIEYSFAYKVSFQSLLNSLPTGDGITTADELLTRNAKGLTPLDNPVFWEDFTTIADQLVSNGSPITKEHVLTPNKDGNPSLCSAMHGRNFVSITKRLNADGIQFNAADLVDESGQPTVLATYAHEQGQLPAFFTHENWRGHHPAELAYTYRHMPEDMQNAIPNFFGLQTKLQREARTQHIARSA